MVTVLRLTWRVSARWRSAGMRTRTGSCPSMIRARTASVMMSEAAIPAVSGLPGRLARLYGGLALYGTGIGLQVESGLGNGPWDVFHQGVGLRAGLSIALAAAC